jgi:Flp pilus assembly pilin Flp
MLKKQHLGQGTTEYIIIVALIAVSAIGVYSFFGKTVRNQVAALATEVAGNDSSTQIANAKAAADSSAVIANKDYNLGNFNEGANNGSGDGDTGGSSDIVD